MIRKTVKDLEAAKKRGVVWLDLNVPMNKWGIITDDTHPCHPTDDWVCPICGVDKDKFEKVT